MIPLDRFVQAASDPDVLNRRIEEDDGQLQIVSAEKDSNLFIVAGPGSGKTTALTLRVLKLVFVDGLLPREIMATTFTRKAASELRSRIVGWGDQARNALASDQDLPAATVDRLLNLDFNQVVTGTLDSIAEQVLGDIREPGTQPPIPLDNFVSDAILLREGLWQGGRYRDQEFEDYLRFLDPRRGRMSMRDKLATSRDIVDRIAHDQVNLDQWADLASRQWPGVLIARQMCDGYHGGLQGRLVVDFAGLEQEFLSRLQEGSLDRFCDQLRALLVDEYQDTNLLQEQIYLELYRSLEQRDGTLTVVGDDDQSLYRFRGATVDLFRNFPERFSNLFEGRMANTIFLSNNYRSTPTIIDWCLGYINRDAAFADARVDEKPDLNPARSDPYEDLPILGLFRNDVGTLAADLAGFVHEVFSGDGHEIQTQGGPIRIIKNPEGGSIGDAALLCQSPREFSGQNPRLPFLLRQELNDLRVFVFNPRGRDFSQILDVERLCGLVLECLDPGAAIQAQEQTLGGNVTSTFNRWRDSARAYVASDPAPPETTEGDRTLADYVTTWQQRVDVGEWPKEVSLLELIYRLITWIPAFQVDPENLVYLETITRAATQAAPFANDSIILTTNTDRDINVIRSILREILVPLAIGDVEIDEDLTETLPRDRFNIMSIHQAKGLEFPLTVVDVGSEFTMNHALQRFKRFPERPERSHRLEDNLRMASPLGPPERDPLDRAFDDLIRKFFVAYSRAKDVLLLVGLRDPDTGLPKQSIPNVAIGDTRTGDRGWHKMQELTLL